jgi:LytR cell envelope-related transcriptional attenuator
MSSPVALMSAAAVVLAGVAFLVTDREVSSAEQVALAAGPAPVERQVVLEAVEVEPTVKRGDIYVSVYNNSNITGLAGTTAQRIVTAGWQVVGSDNWYGTIPATTIYYPEQLEDAAMLLSKDLGIERVVPAVDPMLMDRLTLILTSDFG